MSTQAVLYKRFSPRPSAETCDSIEKQGERLHAWATALGYEVAGEYEDRNESGASMDCRQGLEAAIAHACRIHGILAVYDVSRLSRDVVDAGTILARLNKHHAELAMLVERVDTSTPVGRLTFNVLVSIAQFQRQQGTLRTSRAMKHHQDHDGRRMGRADRIPYGFRLAPADPKRLIPDEGEQETIRLARQYAAETEASVYEVCRHLDGMGVPRRGGKAWRNAYRLMAKILENAQEGH